MRLKKCMFAIMAAILGAGILGGCQIGGKEIVIATELGKDDIFRLNEVNAPMSEAYVFLSEYRHDYGTVYGVDLWESQAADADMERYVKRLALTAMAKTYTMDMLAESKGVTLSEEERRKAEELADIYYDGLDADQAKELDVTRDTVQSVCERYVLAQKLFQGLTSGADTEVSDDEARVMEVQEIFVTSEETADEIDAALKDGKEFSALASYNESEEFDRTITRADIDPTAEEAVYALENGQNTGKIAGEDGFYFYKCVNYYDEDKTEVNKVTIVNTRLQEAFEGAYSEFEDAIDSELNNEAWKKVSVADCTVQTEDSLFVLYDEIFGME